MAPALDVDSIRSSVLPTIISLSADRIPNIRFNVAKAFEVLSTSLGSQSGGAQLVQSEVIPAVEKLRQDSDADVRFFAEKAAQTAQQVVGGGAGSGQSASGEQEAASEEVVMTDA
jgi:serine/threonine-protein phosphatase 2A regulatory subunit A